MQEPVRPRFARSARGWCVAWMVLAVVHVSQAVWSSALACHPGDLRDGRFNQLVLEHGTRALAGAARWESPGMFHPVEGTLGLSDTHAGTLPIYALARALGGDGGRAFQVWFVAIAALNASALGRLLRTLGCDPWIAGPAVFVGCAPMTTVALAGAHPQLLPFFPGLLAIERLARFAKDRKRHHWLAVAGWSAWQFAAGPYLAFFLACLIAPLAFVALRPRRATGRADGDRDCPPGDARDGRSDASSRSIAPPAARGRFAAVAIALIGGALGLAAVHAHVTALGRGYATPPIELFQFAPTVASWVTPPATSFVHRWSLHGAGDAGSGALFFGLVPWLGLFAAVVAALRHRSDPRHRWVLALAGSVAILLLAFTAPTREAGSLFAHVAGPFDVLRAFRATNRCVVLVTPLLAVACAVAASAWLHREVRGRLARGGMLALGVVAAIETIARDQPRTALAEARERTKAVVRAWRAAGDRPVLAFAPGFTNQPGPLAHLDAWSAALALDRATINGYSGSGPETHVGFGFLLSPQAAEALLGLYQIDPARVSIVTDWEPTLAARLGIVRLESRPIAQLEGWDVQPRAWKLFSDLERHVVEGRVMYQFTPPAEAEFPLPDEAASVRVRVAMRPGSYDRGGETDGVTFTWSVRDGAGAETGISTIDLDPRRRPEHRGVIPIDLTLPPGAARTLVLRTSHGPAGDGRWDWPLVGELHVR